jgi:hypothetical protein
MTYYLFDSRGFIGDIASIHGLFELREYFSESNIILQDFFENGYTENMILFFEVLSGTESDDEKINETILKLKDLIPQCRDIAIISDAVETKEDAQRKDEIEKRYLLPKGKKPGIAARRQRARELYKPRGRKVQDFVHAKLIEIAGKLKAEMTRGNHPFDLVIGDNVFEIVIIPPDDLDAEHSRKPKSG